MIARSNVAVLGLLISRAPRGIQRAAGFMLLGAAIAVVLIVFAVTAHGETGVYPYACKVEDGRGNTHLYTVAVDTRKRTITWRGRGVSEPEGEPRGLQDAVQGEGEQRRRG